MAALADQRLLTMGEDSVEVAHEALLREWPRLRGWLAEDVRGEPCTATLIGAAGPGLGQGVMLGSCTGGRG